jgi:hypothetical protein
VIYSYSQLVNSGSVTKNLDAYFNKSCVTNWTVIGDPEPNGQRSATAFGNSGAGIIDGPGQHVFDLALIKRTKLGWPNEAASIEFRTEFFNAFNTPNFANPDTSFTNPTFGRITATSVNPRLIQFALKLNF